MDPNPRRSYRLLAGTIAAVVVVWLVLLATGMLAPAPDTAPVALAETAAPRPTSAASVSPSPDTTQTEPPAPALPSEKQAGTVATRIRIADLGIDLPVYEGDGYTAELGMAAHYPTTSWPGGGSLTYLYAHARDGNFVALWDAELGDIIELELEGGSTVSYSVSRIIPNVRWNDMSWLDPTPSEVLRLQTCNSYEETAPRFIVEATPIEAGQ